jgi:hypothetical protein
MAEPFRIVRLAKALLNINFTNLTGNHYQAFHA